VCDRDREAEGRLRVFGVRSQSADRCSCSHDGDGSSGSEEWHSELVSFDAKARFFAQYAAHVFETAASRRGLGTAIMKYATKMLQQRAGAMPDDDTENGDTAPGPAAQERPPPPSSVDDGQGGLGQTPDTDSRGGGGAPVGRLQRGKGARRPRGWDKRRSGR